MDTPLADFLDSIAKSGTSRLHMPAHKGVSVGGDIKEMYARDITEIKGADSLYEADGIIMRSERNASGIFKTHATYYSAEGSSLAIRAMLTSAHILRQGTVIAVRNAHRAFITTAALLDLDVKWIFPADSGSIVGATVTADEIERAITECKNPSAVYITSPDYLGNITDIRAAADVCARHNVLLLVDNAHGAHLAFTSPSLHPIALGADACCDSAHKTIPPALTGAAYLHFGNAILARHAKDYMAMYGSSSPSYLILRSLDLCNAYLSGRFADDFRTVSERIKTLSDLLSGRFTLVGSDPMKITISAPPSGYTGYELADALRANHAEPEYADLTHLVMMLSVCSREEDFVRIERALMPLEKRPPLNIPYVSFPVLKQGMSIRKAALSQCERIDVSHAEGRIAAITECHCPPCVPVAVSGEIITAECINIFKSYGIPAVYVVK